jgi:hypothetical protein
MRSVIKITSLFILFLLVPGGDASAQSEKIKCAIENLKSSKLDSARMCIDAAAIDSVTSKQAQTWYLRGFIYKEIYKSREAENVKSSARIEALNSFKKSLSLDTASANRESNLQNLKYISIRFYNDAATTMDTLKYKFSIENYENYKEVMKIVDPKMDFKLADITFYNALGTVYTKIFESDKKNKAPYLELAKATYSKVLSLDPNNSSANYNLGILYFNQAVNIINQADYDIDLVALSDLQDNSISLFRQSLPFMERAYDLDPNNLAVLEGLSGIYFSLNDYNKSNQFKEKLEELKNRK